MAGGDVFATRVFQTSETANIITGLTGMELGTFGGIRLMSVVSRVAQNELEIKLGSWGDTHILNGRCSVMSFGADDKRIQTGRLESRDFKPGGIYSEDTPGRKISTRVNFSRPWKKTPHVVAYIAGFDCPKGKVFWCEVHASEIDINGFTINMNTWYGK